MNYLATKQRDLSRLKNKVATFSIYIYNWKSISLIEINGNTENLQSKFWHVTTLGRVRQPDGTGRVNFQFSLPEKRTLSLLVSTVYYIPQGLDLSLLLFGVALWMEIWIWITIADSTQWNDFVWLSHKAKKISGHFLCF